MNIEMFVHDDINARCDLQYLLCIFRTHSASLLKSACNFSVSLFVPFSDLLEYNKIYLFVHSHAEDGRM